MHGLSAKADGAFSRGAIRPARSGIAARLTVIPCLTAGLILAGCGNNSNRSGDPFPDAKPAFNMAATRESPVSAAVASKLPVFELKMKTGDLQDLERSGFSNDTRPATFTANGEVYTVKVRHRGQWARTWPKTPLKIFFEQGKRFEGRHCLNLNSAWRDPAFVREHMAYLVFAASGVPAPRTRMVRLQVNGNFYGLFVEVEQPDKGFLRTNELKGATLFKAVSKSNQADERDLGREATFANHYENETDKSEGVHELQSFCHDLARTTNTVDFFNRRVDLDRYINYLAGCVLVQHWDGFNKNHFLAYDGQKSQKWFTVPWDLDRTFGDHWNGSFSFHRLPVLLGTRELPATTGWNRLMDRFLAEPTLRARFLDRLQNLLEKEFTTEKLFPILDQLESDIGPEAALDRERWGGGGSNLHNGIAQLKTFVKRRRAFLLEEIPKLRQVQNN